MSIDKLNDGAAHDRKVLAILFFSLAMVVPDLPDSACNRSPQPWRYGTLYQSVGVLQYGLPKDKGLGKSGQRFSGTRSNQPGIVDGGRPFGKIKAQHAGRVIHGIVERNLWSLRHFSLQITRLTHVKHHHDHD